MSRRILVTSETPLNVVDPYYCHSFPSYSNELGTDKDYLNIRFTETINVIEMEGIVDTDFLINRVILIPEKQISVGRYTRSIMFCILPHLDLCQPLRSTVYATDGG